MRLIDSDAALETFQGLTELAIGEGAALVKALIFAGLKSRSVTPTIGGWISVKDRLPEDEGDVLVYGVSPRGRKKTAIMNYLAFDADRPRWALDGIWTVLYWMPCPEPPKEADADDT